MLTEKSFPIEEIEINGEKFINMQSDIFCDFFSEVTKYKFDKKFISDLVNQFKGAKRIKRKRIRFKKEKEILLKMYYSLYSLIEK